MEPTTKIAKILRAEPENLHDLCLNMDKICHIKGVLERVVAENDFRVKEILSVLGLSGKSKSEVVYQAIIDKLKKDDAELFELLGRPRCISQEECATPFKLAKDLAGNSQGFFLRQSKAIDILKECPPVNMLQALGYKNVEELLQKEDPRQVFSALRFIESSDWMNNKYIKQFAKLTAADFEAREVEIILLSGKWLKVAEKFVKKKYHNVSHLKELGIIFIIPMEVDTPGETLRIFSLLLHYLYEITFYAKLFRKNKASEEFGKKLISLLRGDVLEGDLPGDGVGKWRIVQRYLAKDDENDQRLFEPHVNPEAIHWDKAENSLTQLDARYPGLEFAFWRDLNFVGDFFPDDTQEILVSFNLIDSVMSLVKEKEMIKYLYHHQEALWNKIFSEYIGQVKMEELILDNFEKGYIDLQKA